MKKQKPVEVVEPIGFIIQGENIIVANPCTIPIKWMTDVLKEKRKKGEATACFAIKLPFNPKEEVKKK